MRPLRNFGASLPYYLRVLSRSRSSWGVHISQQTAGRVLPEGRGPQGSPEGHMGPPRTPNLPRGGAAAAAALLVVVVAASVTTSRAAATAAVTAAVTAAAAAASAAWSTTPPQERSVTGSNCSC